MISLRWIRPASNVLRSFAARVLRYMARTPWGGIVNIVTKRGKVDGVGGSARGEVGGQGYRQGQGAISFGSNRFQGRIGASQLKDGKKQDGGELDLTSFHGSLSFQPSDSSDIRVYARYNDRQSTAFPESSGGLRLAVNRNLETRDAKETIYGADFSFEPTEKIELNIKLANYKRDEDKNTPVIAPADPSDPFTGIPAATSSIDFERRSTLMSALFRLPLNTELTVGYEHLREVGKNRGTLDCVGVSCRGHSRICLNCRTVVSGMGAFVCHNVLLLNK